MNASSGRSWRSTASVVLGSIAALEVAGAVWLCLEVGWSWRQALNAFVVTNSVMGVAFALCGMIIARHRPQNPIGWLFLGDGLGHATTALMAPLAQALLDSNASVASQRLAITLFASAWPWSIGLFLPLALLLFPDGRPASPRWRPVIAAVVATSPLFFLEMATSPEPVGPGLPAGYLTLPNYEQLRPLWIFAEVRTSGALLLALASLFLRFRRAPEARKRQLLWLLAATIIAAAFVLPWSFIAGTPIFVLFSIPLIPAAVAVAIVRHQLLDIRLVLSRAIAWALLSFAAIVSYALVVLLLERFVSAAFGRSAAATVVVALAVSPLLPRIQRLVDRAMYGDRRDPARFASKVGKELLSASDGGLSSVVAAIREALRLPYAALQLGGEVVAADGEPSREAPHTFPLHYAGREVAQLLVGLRAGERQLSGPDEDALGLVAAPLAAAIHATGLSEELQASRQRILTAQEEERRRLRRDLHDGLGPTLTGLAFAADAAENLVENDPAAARELLGGLRRDTRSAILEVRRLVDNLRPRALDELGLVDAIRREGRRLSQRSEGPVVEIEVDAGEVPSLPAAVEVAAFRIATEALTNVVRHSDARTAVVSLRWGDTLDVEIQDDGSPNGLWREGVGLKAMKERAAELGGRCEAGPGTSGGRVYVSFPLVRR